MKNVYNSYKIYICILPPTFFTKPSIIVERKKRLLTQIHWQWREVKKEKKPPMQMIRMVCHRDEENLIRIFKENKREDNKKLIINPRADDGFWFELETKIKWENDTRKKKNILKSRHHQHSFNTRYTPRYPSSISWDC